MYKVFVKNYPYSNTYIYNASDGPHLLETWGSGSRRLHKPFFRRLPFPEIVFPHLFGAAPANGGRMHSFPSLQRMRLMCNCVSWLNYTGPSAGRQHEGSGRPYVSTVLWPGRWKAPAGSCVHVCWRFSHGEDLQENSVLPLLGRKSRYLQTASWALPGRRDTRKPEHDNCLMCLPFDNSLDILVRAKPPYALYYHLLPLLGDSQDIICITDSLG